MRIRHHSNGVANVSYADSAHTNSVIHSEDQEPVLANPYDADSSSWTNGEFPVK